MVGGPGCTLEVDESCFGNNVMSLICYVSVQSKCEVGFVVVVIDQWRGLLFSYNIMFKGNQRSFPRDLSGQQERCTHT